MKTFVEEDPGTLGGFYFSCGSSEKCGKKLTVTGWCQDWRDVFNVRQRDKHQRSWGMCPNWLWRQNKNNTNNFFFYTPKYLSVHTFCSIMPTWTSGSTVGFRTFKKKKKKKQAVRWYVCRVSLPRNVDDFGGKVTSASFSSSPQIQDKKGGELSTPIYADTTHIFKIRIIKQKNRFRYVMARLFLHRFFTHDFTAWRKKNTLYTPVGQVVELKNKSFRKAGISQVSQCTHAIKTVFSIMQRNRNRADPSVQGK